MYGLTVYANADYMLTCFANKRVFRCQEWNSETRVMRLFEQLKQVLTSRRNTLWRWTRRRSNRASGTSESPSRGRPITAGIRGRWWGCTGARWAPTRATTTRRSWLPSPRDRCTSPRKGSPDRTARSRSRADCSTPTISTTATTRSTWWVTVSSWCRSLPAAQLRKFWSAVYRCPSPTKV